MSVIDGQVVEVIEDIEVMDIVVKTDLTRDIPQKIDFNFDELKRSLSLQLEKYNGLVITDDAIGKAKKDRAKLNNLKKAIDDKRKEIKRDYSKPLTDFEAEIKTLTALIDKPIEAIDTQVKAYENVAREAKMQDIKDHFSVAIGELAPLISFERIYEKEWSNVSCKEKDWKEMLDYKVNKIKTDLEVIEGLDSKFKSQMKDKYLFTFDLSLAVGEQKRLEDQEAKMKVLEAEREARMKAWKEEEELRQKAIQEKQAKAAEEQIALVEPEPQQEPEPINEAEAAKVYTYKITMTDDEQLMLDHFLIENDFEFMEV